MRLILKSSLFDMEKTISLPRNDLSIHLYAHLVSENKYSTWRNNLNVQKWPINPYRCTSSLKKRPIRREETISIPRNGPFLHIENISSTSNLEIRTSHDEKGKTSQPPIPKTLICMRMINLNNLACEKR